MSNYFEIKTNGSYRPEHPEDNTVIIESDTLINAINAFEVNKGSIRCSGKLISCREIYYVYSFNPHLIP